mmetsp:Transcript_3687/g.5632  ORF Transcript_3687/g.5632 Transcript_3687/m.5632 type:complete len:732 (-) Transcript_3687:32-2227(-)
MMARWVFISSIFALGVDKLSNAFTIHQLKQTQLQYRSSREDKAFQLNLNPEYESPFWFATFEENYSSLDQSSDFPSPFWFATFEEHDSSVSDGESSSSTPSLQPPPSSRLLSVVAVNDKRNASSRSHDPAEGLKSSLASGSGVSHFTSSFWFATLGEEHSPRNEDESSSFSLLQPLSLSSASDFQDVNPTTTPKIEFKIRDFAMATRNLVEEGAKLVSHVNTTSLATEAVSVAKEVALGLVAVTSTLTETTKAAENSKSAKLAVALATVGRDIVKGVGSLMREAVVDGVTKPLGAAVVDAAIDKPLTKQDADNDNIKLNDAKVDTVFPGAQEDVEVGEQMMIEEKSNQVQNTLEMPKPGEEDVLETIMISAKDQSEEELIELPDGLVGENAYELPKVDDRVAETFIGGTESEIDDNPLDVASVSYLELSKPVEADVTQTIISGSENESDKKIGQRYDQAVGENTRKFQKVEDGVPETLISDAETKTVNKIPDDTSAFGVSETMSDQKQQHATDDHFQTIINEASDTVEREEKLTEFSLVSDAAENEEQSKHGYLVPDDKEDSNLIDSTTTKASTSVVEIKDKLTSAALTWNEVERKEANNDKMDNELALDVSDEITQQRTATESMIDRASSTNGAFKQDYDRSDSQVTSNLPDPTTNNYQSSSTVVQESSDNLDSFTEGGGGYGQGYNNYYDRENTNASRANTRVKADALPSFHDLYQQDFERRTRMTENS